MKLIPTLALLLSAFLFTACRPFEEAPVSENGASVSLAQTLADHPGFQASYQLLEEVEAELYQLFTEGFTAAELDLLADVQARYGSLEEALKRGLRYEVQLVERIQVAVNPQVGDFFGQALDEVAKGEVSPALISEATTLYQDKNQLQSAVNSCSWECGNLYQLTYALEFALAYDGTNAAQASFIAFERANQAFGGCMVACLAGP